MKREFVVTKNEAGKRLDVFLSSKIGGITRSAIKNNIDNGNIVVDGKKSKAGFVVKEGNKIDFQTGENKNFTDVVAENIPLDIVFEDENFAVINKPQGMPVHPSAGHYTGTLVNALLFHFPNTSDIGGKTRPGIVHRIDMDTTGLLVVAKNNKTHILLAKQIAKKTCRRTYIAIVEGILKENEGTIHIAIARDKKDRKKMAVFFNGEGKDAVTHFKVLERFENNTLVEFNLETGRTHQIRVHAKYIGHPIVGDPVYGFSKQKFKLSGQLLHAKRLEFVHPNGKVVSFEAPLPDEFLKVLKLLRKNA